MPSCKRHLSSFSHLDAFLVLPAANFDGDRLGASHTAGPARHRAAQVCESQSIVSPYDHSEGVCSTHLSTGKHIFTVAMEVKHFLVKTPGR